MLKMAKYVLLGLVPIFVICSGISYFVDPYGVRGGATLNLKYPALSKIVRIESNVPETVVIGSDSVFHGIAFSEDESDVFNLGLPDVGIYQIFQYLKFAHEEVGIESAIISLELSMFNAHFMGKEDEYNNYATSNSLFSSVERSWKTLISPTAFVDSIRAIGSEDQDYFSDMGVLNEEISSSFGPANYGKKFKTEEEYYFSSGYFPAGPKRFDFRSIEKDIESFDYVRDIVAYAQKNDIRLAFYIPPYHDRHIELIYRAGLLKQYQNWKRGLVKTLYSEEHGNRGEVADIYDFTGMSDASSEEVPIDGDSRSQMLSYWTGTRYKQSIGKELMDVFKNKEELKKYILSPDNIEGVLASQRKKALVFRSSHARAIKDLQLLSVETSYKRPVKEYSVQLIEAAIDVIGDGRSDKNSVSEQVGYDTVDDFVEELYHYYGVSYSEYLDVVSENYSKRVSLDKLAQAKLLLTNTYLTPKRIAEISGFDNANHFNKVFKFYNSKTPLQYRLLNGGITLRDLSRTEIAKNLLETTELEVVDVVDAAGFGSLSIMKRLFKEETGLLPGEYRKRYVDI